MKKYGGTAKEWFEQVEAFEKVVVGKTPEQAKALVVTDTSKGNDEVIAAGCTISVADFVRAVEKACANAKQSGAKADNMLDLGLETTNSGKDATADAEGNSTLETEIAAAVLDTGYGNDDIQSAGCTVSVSEFTAAAVKALGK